MVIDVHPSRERFVVSHESIPGVMAAMTMPFDVADASELASVRPGMKVSFTLVVSPDGAYAERVQVRAYRTAEQDPFTASRLAVLDAASGANAERTPHGAPVPDVSLVDQSNRPVRLSNLRGRVVALNFIYTSCALPQFCFRVANQFGVLRRRFAERLASDLVLLTVTFDPARDRPEVLNEYARRVLRADGESWRLLTGDPGEVLRLSTALGVEAYQDEGLMNHSSRTVIIDRRGRLVANIEGNEFTPRQLGDLVDSVLQQ